MEPKKKAKELVNQFEKLFIEANSDTWTVEAKQCALIVAEEVIKAKPGGGYMTDAEYVSTDTTEYWEEVKEEIEQL